MPGENVGVGEAVTVQVTRAQPYGFYVYLALAVIILALFTYFFIYKKLIYKKGKK